MKKGSKCPMSMFDSNDFLKLIQEGKISPDTITRDFTDALNAALAAKKQADEEAANADPVIDGLVAARTAAKKAKNFAEADRIRDELKAMGVEIIDTPQGTKWRKV